MSTIVMIGNKETNSGAQGAGARDHSLVHANMLSD